MTEHHSASRPLPRRDFLKAGAAVLGASTLAASRFGISPVLSSRLLDALDPSPLHEKRIRWWREARFGMFVHWGLYSILAGEWQGRTNYGEWIRNNARIPIDEYEKLLGRFNPVEFNADRLAAMAAAAGMRYLVITTKHHDGFCLWNTRQTDWCVSSTPYKRDIMKAVSDACRHHGVVPCWYHSIMDWHHPDYLPRRDWEKTMRPAAGASFDRYVKYLHAQVEELLTKYGHIGVMWFDGEWENTWTRDLGAALAEHCRSLQPDVLINSRVAPAQASGLEAKLAPVALGDFGTPEQKIPDRGLPGVDWESCITMNENWGYNRADKKFKSPAKLVAMLVETASKGGNLLLNVGPTGEGRVPDESVARLQEVGAWMKLHGEAIHGTSASPFENVPFRATRKGRRLNCFLSEWPAARDIVLPGLRQAPRRAWMLGDARRTALPTRSTGDAVVITLPDQPADALCSVVTMEFDRGPVIG